MSACPAVVYRDSGWVNWDVFLGTGRTPPIARSRVLPYWQAQAAAREAGIRTHEQFVAWTRSPGIPSRPAVVYANSGWINWAEFLGTAWLPYAVVAAMARKARVSSRATHLQWDRPDGVPSNPELVYRGRGWVSWGEFLGTGRCKGWWQGNFIPYAEAKKRARAAGICSLWMRPERLPGRPTSHIGTLVGPVGAASWARSGVLTRLSVGFM